MQALRQRAARLALRSRPSATRPRRSYASGHDSHHAEPVNESIPLSVFLSIGVLPAGYAVYSLSRPGPNGEAPAFTKWLQGFDYFQKDWEEKNLLRSQAIDQASLDKHLFLNAGRNKHVDLKTPELIGVASPYNVPAGHMPNMAYVTEHYRKQYQVDEERKLKKLQAAREQAEKRA